MLPGIIASGMRRVGLQSTDPYWNNVELLLHMDGVNGSSLFIDSSSRSRPINGGSCTISTTRSVYGDASGFAPANLTGAITVTGNNNLSLGTGDFTIEMYIYFNGLTSSFTGLISWGESTGQFYWMVDSTRFFSNGSGFVNHGLVLNEWSHIAITRQSGQMRYFVRGVQVGTTWTRTTDYITVAGRPQIGHHQAPQLGLNTHIDELRITKGVARYTANFIPPIVAFS